MKIGESVRQGDVLVTRIAALPQNAKLLEPQSRIVLALGEVTGHSHAVVSTFATEWIIEQASEIIERGFAVAETATESALLVHEEHTLHMFPPGLYRVTIQVEEDDEGVRNVTD